MEKSKLSINEYVENIHEIAQELYKEKKSYFDQHPEHLTALYDINVHSYIENGEVKTTISIHTGVNTHPNIPDEIRSAAYPLDGEVLDFAQDYITFLE
ncbi:MAG TPA: hypothetical protein VK808_03025 [Bacteroidia bacterium]|jgi:hypothetical protein|nr:hypothetical protein [Bacteroidia bacterium]